MRDWQLRVDDLPDPTPGPGQVLTKVLACGICGSDLHMLRHGEEARRLTAELQDGAAPDAMAMKMFEPQHDTVMGHEFCCEVVELGPGCSNLKEGDVVVSLPVAFDAEGLHAVGYSNRYNGGYAELMVLNELTGIKVPSGLPAEMAALTEPLAVGIHAVAKSRIAGGDAAIVLGAGPVGLACVAELRMRGIGPIVVADFSAKRRELAARAFAHTAAYDTAVEVVELTPLDDTAVAAIVENIGCAEGGIGFLGGVPGRQCHVDVAEWHRLDDIAISNAGQRGNFHDAPVSNFQ